MESESWEKVMESLAWSTALLQERDKMNGEGMETGRQIQRWWGKRNYEIKPVPIKALTKQQQNLECTLGPKYWNIYEYIWGLYLLVKLQKGKCFSLGYMLLCTSL